MCDLTNVCDMYTGVMYIRRFEGLGSSRAMQPLKLPCVRADVLSPISAQSSSPYVPAALLPGTCALPPKTPFLSVCVSCPLHTPLPSPLPMYHPHPPVKRLS